MSRCDSTDRRAEGSYARPTNPSAQASPDALNLISCKSGVACRGVGSLDELPRVRWSGRASGLFQMRSAISVRSPVPPGESPATFTGCHTRSGTPPGEAAHCPRPDPWPSAGLAGACAPLHSSPRRAGSGWWERGRAGWLPAGSGIRSSSLGVGRVERRNPGRAATGLRAPAVRILRGGGARVEYTHCHVPRDEPTAGCATRIVPDSRESFNP